MPHIHNICVYCQIEEYTLNRFPQVAVNPKRNTEYTCTQYMSTPPIRKSIFYVFISNIHIYIILCIA